MDSTTTPSHGSETVRITAGNMSSCWELILLGTWEWRVRTHCNTAILVVTEIWEGEVYSLPEERGGKWW